MNKPREAVENAGESGGRRADSQQLVRQWALLRLLSASGRAWPVKELAEQLAVSKATVQRDLFECLTTLEVSRVFAAAERLLSAD